MKEKIEQELEKYFENETGIIKEFVMRGGKRIRPIIMNIGYNLYKEGFLGESIIFELLQAFFLMVDDVMDESELRRGKKTVHKIIGEEWKNEKLGENLAICYGNIAQTRAYEIIDNITDKRIRIRMYEKVNQICKETYYGQVMDLELSAKDIEQVTEKEIIKMMEMKTAKYTIEGPLHCGAIMAGRKNLKKLTRIAIPLGIAFQIKDDIIGLYGDEKIIGKPVDSDLKEGKKTLLILKAYEKNKEIKKYMNKDLTREEMETARRIISETGALNYSLKLIEKLTEKGMKEIEKLKAKEQGKQELLKIAVKLKERNY